MSHPGICFCWRSEDFNENMEVIVEVEVLCFSTFPQLFFLKKEKTHLEVCLYREKKQKHYTELSRHAVVTEGSPNQWQAPLWGLWSYHSHLLWKLWRLHAAVGVSLNSCLWPSRRCSAGCSHCSVSPVPAARPLPGAVQTLGQTDSSPKLPLHWLRWVSVMLPQSIFTIQLSKIPIPHLTSI